MKVLSAEDGALFPEASISIATLFLTIFLGLDLSIGQLRDASLNHVLNEASRTGSLGITLPGKTREESIKEILIDKGAEFGLKISEDNIRICPLDEPDCDTDDAAGPEEFTIVSVELPTRNLFSGYTFTVKGSTLVLNEPYA